MFKLEKSYLAVTHPSTNITLYCLTSLIDISLHSVTYPLCFDTNLDIFSYTYTTGSKLSISTLGLDRDLGFSRGYQGHQGHRPHDDDEEDNDDEVEDNNKDDDDYKVISALELDRDMGFSRGHQGNQEYRPHDDDNEE